ncbi:MAG: RHS repeat protein, partial [FCB group bacterium]|nr:RHS repeat protein [FCB group bacterium]
MGRKSLVQGPFKSDGPICYPMTPISDEIPLTKTTYDGLGRQLVIEQSHGVYQTVKTVFTYSGFFTTITDPDGKLKTEKKDHLNRIVQIEEHGDNDHSFITRYFYNPANDLVRVLDASGNTTRIVYDSLGRKIVMSDPDMGIWRYSYDANNNLLTQTDAKNQTIRFTYDVLNRVLTKTYSTRDAPVIYEYDLSINGTGRLFSVQKGEVATTHNAYDAMGRELSVTKTIPGADPKTTNYEYDLTGKITRMTYPDGFQLNYTYYPKTGLIHSLTGPDSIEFAKYSNYEPTGKIGWMENSNGVVTRYTYDPLSTKLTGIRTYYPGQGDEEDFYLQKRTYQYTRAGDIETIEDELRGVTYTYAYDNLHRLLTETATPGGAINYSYDRIGNILSKTEGINFFVYEYNETEKPHALQTIVRNNATYTFTHDPNGNMTHGYDLTEPATPGNRIIHYNADNMPTKIVYQKNEEKQTTTFIYNGHGKRAKKITTNEIETFYYGEHYELSNESETKYIFAGNQRIAQVTSTGTQFFHKDHLGSTTAMTDETGSQIETAEYLPYGLQRESIGENTTAYKFTDQELDPTTNLYNYDARLYDPAIGRFISPDNVEPDYTDPQSL